MATPIEEIKDKIDIVDFIKGYIPLKPAGRNFKALCPFHKEKTPSFIVSPERQIWHCFGCSKGGDVIKFLMEYENLEFYEALQILAEKAGIELKRIDPAEHKQIGILYDISEKAKEFFKRNLANSSEVLAYLKNRGLKEETIREFELGLSPSDFSPYGRDELTRHLINFGYSIFDIERSGLSLKNKEGLYIDRFRERIIFPIYNHFSKVVAFGGRILPWAKEADKLAKYINSPDSLIYNKSRTLYGFHKTKNQIKNISFALLVEGYLDFLMSYQDGVKNIVAISGTALTSDQLRTLKRYTDQLIFCFDADDAGQEATERSIDQALASDFNVKILSLKDVKDPAELVLNSPGKLEKLMKEAKPIMDFYFDYYEISDSSTISGLEISDFKKNLRSILSKIKNLTSAIERNFWLKQLSKKTGLEENSLIEELEKISVKKEAEEEIIDKKIPFSRQELISQRLIALMLLDKTLQAEYQNLAEFFSEEYQKIFNNLTKNEKLENKRQGELANYILLNSSIGVEKLDEEKIRKEFEALVKEIKIEYLKGQRGILTKAIKEAEKSGDERKLNSILSQFDELSKRIQNR